MSSDKAICEKHGYRGYVSSRPVRSMCWPQRVQNLVIRDYAKRKQLNYLLSSTEFVMPGCYMMLQDAVNELPKLDGLILFSAFMLPQCKIRRLKIYEAILVNNCVLHAGLEEMVLKTEADIEHYENVIEVVNTLPQVPLNDAYKSFSLKMDEQDPFVDELFKAF